MKIKLLRTLDFMEWDSTIESDSCSLSIGSLSGLSLSSDSSKHKGGTFKLWAKPLDEQQIWWAYQALKLLT